MGEDEREYDIERDLEDMKDLLRTEDIDCPACSSPMSPSQKKCSVCGFEIKRVEDDEFRNKLKATMWAPGIERGVPLGRDLPPPQGTETPSKETEDESKTKELEELLSTIEEQEELPEEEVVKKALSFREKMKMTMSVALILFGFGFYVLTAVFHDFGFSVLALMVLGTVFVLIGGNLGFDVILDSKKRESISIGKDIRKAMPTLREKLLKPGDSTAKLVWLFVALVGALSYVLMPMLSGDEFLRFVGMGMGSVLIVFGVSFAYNAFFHARPQKKKEREQVFEAFVETEKEEMELEWACPICSAPLEEDVDVCPVCGTEFED